MKYVLYATFLLLAFSNKSIFGHIYLVEIPILIGLIMLLIKKGGSVFVFNKIDGLVLTYAVFSLISVAVGIDSFYESARFYRLMVLTPVLIYVFIRLGSISLEQLRKALFYVIPGTLFQGMLFIQYYIAHGTRPVGVEGTVSTITLSVLLVISLFILLFNFKDKPRGFIKLVRYALIPILFVMLIISGTRAALLGFVIMAIAIILLWAKNSRRVWIGRGMLISIFFLLTLVISGSVLFTDVEVENVKEEATSVNRLFNLEMYLWDISGRVAFWGRIANRALENPVFGSGGASHSIGKSGGTKFELGSAHNVLVSTLVTSGVPGLIILLSLIWAVYSVFKYNKGNRMQACEIAKVSSGSVTVLLMVAITNDFSGGRGFIWFTLLAVCAFVYNELSRQPASTDTESYEPGSKPEIDGERSTSVRLRVR